MIEYDKMRENGLKYTLCFSGMMMVFPVAGCLHWCSGTVFILKRPKSGITTSSPSASASLIELSTALIYVVASR